jgi:FkbM family methyltransferase
MSLQESLNGGYAGLYGEVVESDVYEMRDVEDIVSVNDPSFVHVKGHKRGFDFIPDVILDLGANVGVFTRYCRELFPEALIVAIEPHPGNFEYLLGIEGNTTLFNMGIGIGKLLRTIGAANGSGESYISESSLGFMNMDIDDQPRFETTDVESVTLKELFDEFVKPGQKIIVKMDIEGAENSLFGHEESVKCLLAADYVVIEIHNYAIVKKDTQAVVDLTNSVLKRFEETHDCKLDHIYFYAVRSNSDKA